ncbi:DNA binding protein [Mycobacterium phage Luchador]|uniref:DNA binding protein n=1 Tax=Mycobacterium phage Luchador TaxID=1647300 RepID=A0A0F6SJH4_9CAUD|nr:sigma-K factor [Mycobacterium phage Luchador]AKF14222.1 DNA binding protein [Mycobacterium phage Luchador]
MDEADLNKAFQRAAWSALVTWKGDFRDGDELANDLWVWYLERPSVQKKLEYADSQLRHTLIRKQALSLLSGKAMDDDVAGGRWVYSSESVKDALKGESTNQYLAHIMPQALEALEDKNPDYAEALRSRYTDGVKPQGAASDRLLHAHRAIAEQVNLIARTAGLSRDDDGNLVDKGGPEVFPESRREKSAHGDPTADVALDLYDHGDEPISYKGKPDYLCMTYVDDEGARRALRIGGEVVYSGQTTTLRKEFR